jgi:L-amino acid N-acyltransferase YncA
VVVTSDRRSAGIGTALVRHVVVEARKLGVATLTVRPVARNAAAIALFAREGFATVGQIDLFQELAPTGREWYEGATIGGTQLRV